MKILVVIMAALITAGCTTVPVKQTFPVLPDELAKSCKPLVVIDGDKTTISELMKTVSKNYGSRHECASQLEAIKEWYAAQKKIFDDANK